MRYETVIGLEVHVELSTRTKLFCRCPASFGAGPNENACPACAGYPGAPPVLNRRAVELGIAAGILTNGKIANRLGFDKKSYFYPDLPCGFQITQWFAPVSAGGYVDIETGGGKKRITLKQIHIEEDAGKLVHDPASGTTLADYNRTGVPLIEIVSNADFRAPEEATAYLEKLRRTLSFAGVSDCRMQEGSMRCDVNISVREAGAAELGTRVEIKNMNSLKMIAAAIEYESKRQIEAIETGSEKLVQETRRWDDVSGETFAMREKEDATDYRYFPDAEILPVEIGEDWIDEIRASLPESSEDKLERYKTSQGLPEYDAAIIAASSNLSRLFDETRALYENPKEIANWIIVELLAIAKGDNKGTDDINIDCGKFAALLKMVENKRINRNNAKKILPNILKDGADPEAYAMERGLLMTGDAGELARAASETVAENEKSVSEYLAGNQKAFGHLMGRAMKKLGGRADPKKVGAALNEKLKNLQ